MVLENASNRKSHHHRNSMKEFRVSYAAEEPKQVLECVDMRRTKSEKVSRRKATKEDNVDKEAEAFIKFEHSKWMSESS
ncbi:unnamed protein product [Brassica rapa]|uniref:Uncharacterized protein n=1 Tax=Brassica campestris TaxID=3711 RepID=A0A3P5YPH9_BRACM|nr:unnamed protein product [Brassica rapa]VDC61788.1 unnamed protein product [Brassica rapa]